MFVLPNITLASSIETEFTILAGTDDARVESLKRLLPTFKTFVSRFRDAFGMEITPTVFLIRADAPQTFHGIDAFASFRDSVAISAVCYSGACALKNRRQRAELFGNAFGLYPWTVARDGEGLLAITPAICGIRKVNDFHGQTSPELPHTQLDISEMDKPLLNELLNRWCQHFNKPTSSRSDIALFRSLNMAYHASLLPAPTEMRLYDVGRLTSLWVSAFEILAHPGKNGRVNIGKVFELLERIDYKRPQCAKKCFNVCDFKRVLACCLYKFLYNRRNDFLHGNPVDENALQLPKYKQNIFTYAAPLYRLALTAFLPLVFSDKKPQDPDFSALGEFIARGSAFSSYQISYEDALMTALNPPPSSDPEPDEEPVEDDSPQSPD